MMASERERLSSEEAMESLRVQLQAQTERMEADAMRKAVRKLHDIKRVSAFAAWTELVTERKHMRHVAGRVVRRMQHALLADALGGWVDHVSWVVHSKGLVDRMLTMWTQRGLSKAMGSWRSWASTCRSHKRALRKAVMKMGL